MTTSIEDSKNEIIQCFRNVTHFRSLEGDEPIQYTWEIRYDDKQLPKDDNIPIYFILDTYNHEAFSHWVYENASWLPYYLELKKQYPSIRVVIQRWKDYKKLYFQYYGVPLESVCLPSEIEPLNYCYFHSYTSFNDKQEPPIYFYNLENYKQKINTISVEKTIPLLYLPRGIKENLSLSNNRVYNIQDDLKECVKQLGGTVYETDLTTSLEEQIKIVKSSRIIVLDYGSNLWVNGLFADKSHIIALNIGWHQHPQYIAMGAIWDKIHLSNSLEQIFAYPSDQKTEKGIAIVSFHLPVVIKQIMLAIQMLQPIA